MRRFKQAGFVTALCLAFVAPAFAQQEQKSTNPDTPEVDACRAAGLIALKEATPAIKDVAIDPDSIRLFRMDKKIGEEAVKAIVVGEVTIERTKTSKPRSLVCIVGDKGKVLVTYFTSQ